MNRLTVISKNINKREINMVIVHSFADAHKEAMDAMERGCDEAVVEDEVHNVLLRLIKPKKTNFDRITISPEALAEFICDISFYFPWDDSEFCCRYNIETEQDRLNFVRDWLNEESKE